MQGRESIESGSAHDSPPPVRGCLSRNWVHWQSVVTEAWTVKVLDTGYRIPFLHHPTLTQVTRFIPFLQGRFFQGSVLIA